MKILSKRICSVTVLLLFLIALTCLALYLKNVADYKQAVKETTFSEINISDVSDGVYIGEYDVNFIYAKVEVTVQDRKIKNISILEHKNERGKSAEIIIDKILDAQRIDVDTVSGATNSSIVIKKAVENAIKGTPQPIAGYHFPFHTSCIPFHFQGLFSSTYSATDRY